MSPKNSQEFFIEYQNLRKRNLYHQFGMSTSPWRSTPDYISSFSVSIKICFNSSINKNFNYSTHLHNSEYAVTYFCWWISLQKFHTAFIRVLKFCKQVYSKNLNEIKKYSGIHFTFEKIKLKETHEIFRRKRQF